MGDWYEEMAEELERIDAHENAPEPEPITDEELDDWASEWDDSPVYED